MLRSVLALLLFGLLATSAGAVPPPVNPWTAPAGTAAQHGDSLASDTTPLPGPGAGDIATTAIPLGAVCPSVLIGSDQQPVALCVAIANQAPVVYLLDPDTGRVRDGLALTKGDLFSGVYPYMDRRNRVVIADGTGALLRISHDGGKLAITRRTPLGQLRGSVVGLAADFRGRPWFATSDGDAGYVDKHGGVHTLSLPAGETVANSIAAAPRGVAVATDHAQYLLRARTGGRPRVIWRQAYDRGPARKPGQLSQGTGSTPTFFGPKTGAEWLAIVDNATPTEHLIVYRVKDGRPICDLPVIDGDENSPIGYGRSVVVASTYGYPYPASPSGPTVPASAPFVGGMSRIDVRRSGCKVAWTAPVRSAAVPKLSIADGLIYTVGRGGLSATATPLDTYSATTVDFATGATRSASLLGATTVFDTLELAGNIGPGQVLWQGTMTGVLRITGRTS